MPLLGEWVSRAELPELLKTAAQIYRGVENMAMQQGQSSLFGKYAGQVMKAHQQATSKEPEIFGSNLPVGINNGVARIVKCEIVKHKGKDEKDPFNGLPEFAMTAVCISPDVFDNVQCKGKQFRLSPPVPLYDTPSWKSGGSFLEHYERMLDLLRIYVGKDVWKESGYFDGDTPQQVEANLLRCMKDLAEKGPYFNFNTRAGKKQQIENKGGRFWVRQQSYASREEALEKNPNIDREPLPQINWNDLLPNYSEQNNVAAGFDDQSGIGQIEEPPVDPHAMTPENEFDPQNTEDASAPTTMLATGEESEGEVDLAALVDVASEDEQARERLIEIAGQFGIDRETAENTATWDELKDMIEAAASADSRDAPDEPQVWTPSKGETRRYQLLNEKGQPVRDKKSKKPLNPVNVEITNVNAEKQTVTLKNLENGGKPILGADKKSLQVPWDQLLPSE